MKNSLWPALILCVVAACFVDSTVQAGEVKRTTPPETATAQELPSANVFLSPETGLVIDAGESRFELHGYAWFRAQSDTRVGDETDLEGSIPVGRLFAIGSLLDSKLVFFAQPEFAGSSVKLLDLFAEWRFDPAFQIRVGQFRLPYSRAYITPLTNLELTSRGLVIDQFSLGRDTGAMVSGLLAKGLVHYDLAVVNGATINNLENDRDAPAVVARTEFRFGEPVPYDQAPSLVLKDPKGLTLGMGGAYSRRAVRGPTGTSTEELWNAALDVAWMHGPISVRAESFVRSSHNSPRVSTAFGAYAQIGTFVVPRKIEVGTRAGWLTDGPDVQTYEAFLAGYWKSGERALGHHLKTILSYRFDSRDADGLDGSDRHVLRIQTQIFF